MLNAGNPSKLNLGKFKAQLNPTRYIPNEPESSTGIEDRDASNWLTIQGLISDIWWAYKFEPFKNKLEMLFRACDYKVDAEIQRQLTKHVHLRNCIQHHQRQVTPDALKQTGVQVFTMLGKNKEVIKLTAWSRV